MLSYPSLEDGIFVSASLIRADQLHERVIARFLVLLRAWR
jgi:hypothetical protein